MSVRDARWQVEQSVAEIAYSLPHVEQDWAHRDLTEITEAFAAFKAAWEATFGAPDPWH